MVDQLTSARHDLAETANSNLGKFVDKLEGAVSEIPVYTSKPRRPGTPASERAPTEAEAGADKNEDSEATSCFHRDVGIQTSASFYRTTGIAPTPATRTVNQQASSLHSLITQLQSLNEDLAEDGEFIGDVETVMHALRDDMDKLAAESTSLPPYYGVSGYLYGGVNGGRSEPEDEIKKVKESIRRVKGVLLSARTFPTAAGVGVGR